MFNTNINIFQIVRYASASLLVLLLSVNASAEDGNARNTYIAGLPAIDCVINPYQVIDIASPVRGVIDKLHVDRSDPVKSGQVVAQLASDVEQATVKLAQKRASIKSEINVSKINLAFNAQRKQRYQKLYKDKAVSKENVDEADKEHDLSIWKVQQSKEQIDVRDLELKRAHEQLKQKTIRSPISGYVLDTFKHSGEYVEEQAIMRIAQLDPLIIEAIMPMEVYGQVKVGMSAEIQPEVLSSDNLTGKVTVVDRIGDTASGTFGVRMEMPNPDSRLPAGLKCVAKFIEGEPEPIAKVEEPVAEEPAKEIVEIEPQVETPVLMASTDVTSTNYTTDVQPPLDNLYNSVSNEVIQQALAEATNNGVEEGAEIKQEPKSEVAHGFVTLDELDSMSRVRTVFVTERYRDENVKNGYIVLLPQGETRQANRKLVRTLRELGVYDFIAMKEGRYKGFISLGTFNGPITANKRRKELNNLGIYAALDEW